MHLAFKPPLFKIQTKTRQTKNTTPKNKKTHPQTARKHFVPSTGQHGMTTLAGPSRQRHPLPSPLEAPATTRVVRAPPHSPLTPPPATAGSRSDDGNRCALWPTNVRSRRIDTQQSHKLYPGGAKLAQTPSVPRHGPATSSVPSLSRDPRRY